MLKTLRRYALSLLSLGAITVAEGITYESWALGEFSNVGAAEAAPGADPDEDGISNLREYAFDLDPNEPDVSPEEGGLLQHTDGNHYLYMTFPRRTDATDLTFEVRAKDAVYDLCEGDIPYLWENGSLVSSAGLIGTAGTTLTVIDNQAPLESNVFRGFLQLFIVQQPVEQAIDFVTVGDPGNPSDGGMGSVSYEFQMGQCEITNDQYAEFLNAVAAEDNWTLVGSNVEPLFAPGMQSDARGGIRRHGEQGAYTYSVKPLMGNKPVIYVSFLSACRYCNWLHNGKPRPRCRRIMEATTEDGAYDLTDRAQILTNSIVRKAGANYAIPTEDEWVKAAYYDPTKSGGGGYWMFGTKHDEDPGTSDGFPIAATANFLGNIANASNDNVINYRRGADWDSDLDGVVENNMIGNRFNVEDGNLTTVASGGSGSESYYGVSDADGNVSEWTETALSNWARVERGASWKYSDGQVGKDWRVNQPFYEEMDHMGFRVCKP